MEKEFVEFDFKKLFKIIWKKKIMVLMITVVFFIIGTIISFMSPYEYTATTTMIPAKVSGGSTSINQLASLAGFDFMGGGSDQIISPDLYPTIIKSTPFLKELSQFKIKTKDYENRILLKDFLNNYSKLGFIDIFKKDILEKKIKSLNIESIKKENKKLDLSSEKYFFYSDKDKSIYKLISEKIFINYDVREGVLSIQATMPDPISAAELAQQTTDLLQKKIIDFEIKKAKEELIFLEKKHFEIQKEYNEKKYILAEFQDKNSNLRSARSNIMLSQLQFEFNLISDVFLQISQKLESQKLQVKKETPVFSIIEPVHVPLIRSSPIRTKILKIWIVSGFIVAILTVLLFNSIKYLKLIIKNL